MTLKTLLDVLDPTPQRNTLHLLFSKGQVFPANILQRPHLVHIGLFQLGSAWNEVSFADDVEGHLVDGVAEVAEFEIGNRSSSFLTEGHFSKLLKLFHLPIGFDPE